MRRPGPEPRKFNVPRPRMSGPPPKTSPPAPGGRQHQRNYRVEVKILNQAVFAHPFVHTVEEDGGFLSLYVIERIQRVKRQQRQLGAGEGVYIHDNQEVDSHTRFIYNMERVEWYSVNELEDVDGEAV